MRLENRIAIVTGAAGGIGAASVRRFAQEGAKVTAADIDGERLERTVAAVNAEVPGSTTARAADVRKAAEVEALVASTVAQRGRLDIVFSNAGIMRDGSVVDLPESDWDEMFSVNVKGTFLLGKYGVPAMREGGGGAFVITASANSFYAESDIAGYCATKGAVIQLTRAMAIDHGPENIRVNCICPGWIETPMSQPFLDENPEGRKFAGKIAPLGRIGQPEEVAEVAVFLASDEARFVTASAFNCDGGWTAGMTKALALI